MIDSILKTKRVAIPSGLAALGGTTITVTWDRAFTTANYTVIAVVEDATAFATASLQVERIVSKTASQVVFKVINLNALGVGPAATLHVMGVQDQ